MKISITNINHVLHNIVGENTGKIISIITDGSHFGLVALSQLARVFMKGICFLTIICETSTEKQTSTLQSQ